MDNGALSLLEKIKNNSYHLQRGTYSERQQVHAYLSLTVISNILTLSFCVITWEETKSQCGESWPEVFMTDIQLQVT